MSTSELLPTAPSGARRPLVLNPYALTGLGYTLSWVAGLSIGAPSPELRESGPSLVAMIHGHQGLMATQFVLTEGLPAIGLAVLGLGLARAARGGAARTLRVTAPLAALVSLVQCVLGVVLSFTTAPGTAHALWEGVARLDGVKMLTLAVVGAVTAASAVFPGWQRILGVVLAVTIAASGVAYGLLLDGAAWLAYPAGIALLAFFTAAGFALARLGRDSGGADASA